MVTTGFSDIYVAVYSASGQTVTYTELTKLARARSLSLSLDTTDDNNYYADNELAETESGASFTSGTVEITVDGLDGDEEALIYGIPTEDSTVQVNDSPVAELRFGDSMKPPFMGVAGIKSYQMNGVVTWRPIVLTKCQFIPSGDDAETQEDTINWQSQTLNASVMRDDTAERNWKRMPQQNCATKQAAIDYITAVLGGAAAAAAAASAQAEKPATISTETPAPVN